jgi:hypothetical protein
MHSYIWSDNQPYPNQPTMSNLYVIKIGEEFLSPISVHTFPFFTIPHRYYTGPVGQAFTTSSFKKAEKIIFYMNKHYASGAEVWKLIPAPI